MKNQRNLQAQLKTAQPDTRPKFFMLLVVGVVTEPPLLDFDV